MSALDRLRDEIKECLPSLPLQSVTLSPEFSVISLLFSSGSNRHVFYGDVIADIDKTLETDRKAIMKLIGDDSRYKRMYYTDNIGTKKFLQACWLDKHPKLIEKFRELGIHSIFEIPENRVPNTHPDYDKLSKLKTNFVVTYDENCDIKNVDYKEIGIDIISLRNLKTKYCCVYIGTVKFIYNTCVNDAGAIEHIGVMIDELYKKYREQIDAELEYTFLRDATEILLNLEFWERENQDVATRVYEKACQTLGLEFNKEKYRT